MAGDGTCAAPLLSGPIVFLAGIVAAISVMAAAPALAQNSPPSPVLAFLQAADTGDADSMMAALGKGALPKPIEGCYLRRVYADPSGGVIAAWMCAEGENASRVVLGEVSQSGKNARLRIVRETRNAMPAPERTGPALAPEPKSEMEQ